jgi:hypothetical protein
MVLGHRAITNASVGAFQGKPAFFKSRQQLPPTIAANKSRQQKPPTKAANKSRQQLPLINFPIQLSSDPQGNTPRTVSR